MSEALLQALQQIRELGGKCIYSHSEEFREGSAAAYAQCADIASRAIDEALAIARTT
jgi:hypothetical protein